MGTGECEKERDRKDNKGNKMLNGGQMKKGKEKRRWKLGGKRQGKKEHKREEKEEEEERKKITRS